MALLVDRAGGRAGPVPRASYEGGGGAALTVPGAVPVTGPPLR
ncbi:hypothetical protein GCM10010433_52760 [Streptomyces pulveraceus]|uniref:Uncharacterized protein n=1 Tax=Streptomyces pulveraceus TaxID=68258 RepID=A0ABW1GUL0_9ACTN